MKIKVITLLVLVAVGSLVVAGCGSSSSSSSTSTPSSGATSSTSAPSSSAAAASSTPAPSSSSGGGATSAAAAAAKQGCEAGVKNNPALDASKRSELSTACQNVADAAASGDKAKFKAAYTSFCTKLVGALPAAEQTAAKPACIQGANAIP
jgi:hypothetical protein